MPALKSRSQFYRTLATLEEAGVPRSRSLQQGHRGAFRRAGAQMGEMIASRGVSLQEAMESSHRLFSPFVISLVAFGEQTGRLELVFTALADWFDLIRRLRGQVISGLIYPALQYHAAAVLIPAIGYFMKEFNQAQALLRIGLLLAIPYALAFLFFVVLPLLFPGGKGLPAPAAGILLHVPLIGGLSYKLNCTRFFRAFGLALQAGVGVADAASLSAASCTNALLRLRFTRMAEAIKREGCTFTEAFRAHMGSRERNSMVMELMHTGEQAGAADEMAGRIANVYGEEVEETLNRIAKIVPVLVYLCLALYIGYQIVRFYGKLFEQINSLL